MSTNRYHHLAWHHGIEFFEAFISNQTFARHAHEGFAIGAIVEGAGGYLCRGERMVLPAGSLSLMNPEEPHTGQAASTHVRYNMLYTSEAAVRAILDLRKLRGFAEITPQDNALLLTRSLAKLSTCLNAPSSLDRRMMTEEAVHAVLAHAFSHYGGAELRRPGQERAAVRQLLDRIAEGVAAGEALSLSDLAAYVDLNPSYLIRSVKRATGMTPHEHVLRHRVCRAKDMLLNGVPASEAAVDSGFCDQSHMIRHLRRSFGVTPGAIIRH